MWATVNTGGFKPAGSGSHLEASAMLTNIDGECVSAEAAVSLCCCFALYHACARIHAMRAQEVRTSNLFAHAVSQLEAGSVRCSRSRTEFQLKFIDVPVQTADARKSFESCLAELAALCAGRANVRISMCLTIIFISRLS